MTKAQNDFAAVVVKRMKQSPGSVIVLRAARQYGSTRAALMLACHSELRVNTLFVTFCAKARRDVGKMLANKKIFPRNQKITNLDPHMKDNLYFKTEHGNIITVTTTHKGMAPSTVDVHGSDLMVMDRILPSNESTAWFDHRTILIVDSGLSLERPSEAYVTFEGEVEIAELLGAFHLDDEHQFTYRYGVQFYKKRSE